MENRVYLPHSRVRLAPCGGVYPLTDERQPMESKPGPSIGADTATASDAATFSGSPAVISKSPTGFGFLPVGTLLASRYEIVQLLGEGGMGAVYKALDRELDRIVALKVIRPNLAGHEWILQRFKQELILARQITHRNVIRIYDLGEAAGMKFITMEYVEGETLKTILQHEGKLPPPEAAKIIRQVCQGLVAAHAEGVIHRDLKPGNIIRDTQGRMVVMDFGLAHSVEAPRAAAAAAVGNDPTHTGFQTYNSQPGALVGTPAYMAPEQALGEEADARSDVFAVGIIFFELLSGRTPFDSASPTETLRNRPQEKPKTFGEIGAKVPHSVARIAERCLETKPVTRYQTAAQVLADLDQYLAPFLRKTWKWMAVAAVLLLTGTEFVVQQRITQKPGTQHAPVSVLVADFKNETGDPVFDSTLEPALERALEGASFVNAYNRGQALQVASQLRPGARNLDDTLARLVAGREGINVIVVGSIARQGSRYAVESQAMDPVSGKTMVSSKVTASDKNAVLGAANTLAARVRRTLGDTTPESVQIAAVETFSTGSLEAAHEYALAGNADSEGRWNEAIQHGLKAVQLDPDLGRAYDVIAVQYHNMGQPQEAEKYFTLALSKIDHMSEREKYRTRGAYYLMMREPDKALEEFTQLVSKYPADDAGHANLALAYFYRRDMAHALEEGRRAIAIYPNHVVQRSNVGLYGMYAGDFSTGIKESKAALEMNRSFVPGYIGVALSQLGQGHPEESSATYEELAKIKPQGTSSAASGLADVALYDGQVPEAIKILEQGARADLANKNADGAANKLAILAQAYLMSGNEVAAAHASDQALQQSKETGIVFWAARAYLGAKKPQKALSLSQELSNSLEADPQAYGKLIEAEYAMNAGKAREALQLIADSRKFADTWMGRYDAALAYLSLGAYAEADSELEVCLKRRGEATALFLDESPTYHLFPPVYYYLGRAQEGLKSPAAADSFKTFLAMKDKAEHDPLVADARRRAGSM
jgi:serine/threonine protein kinase/tetratricopeptide (TPR) repeat protein